MTRLLLPVELVFESLEIPDIAQDTKYLEEFSYFIMNFYVVSTH